MLSLGTKATDVHSFLSVTRRTDVLLCQFSALAV
jgi:hypothetical protein